MRSWEFVMIPISRPRGASPPMDDSALGGEPPQDQMGSGMVGKLDDVARASQTRKSSGDLSTLSASWSRDDIVSLCHTRRHGKKERPTSSVTAIAGPRSSSEDLFLARLAAIGDTRFASGGIL